MDGVDCSCISASFYTEKFILTKLNFLILILSTIIQIFVRKIKLWSNWKEVRFGYFWVSKVP